MVKTKIVKDCWIDRSQMVHHGARQGRIGSATARCVPSVDGDGDVEANCDVVSISFYPRVPAADE